MRYQFTGTTKADSHKERTTRRPVTRTRNRQTRHHHATLSRDASTATTAFSHDSDDDTDSEHSECLTVIAGQIVNQPCFHKGPGSLSGSIFITLSHSFSPHSPHAITVTLPVGLWSSSSSNIGHLDAPSQRARFSFFHAHCRYRYRYR